MAIPPEGWCWICGETKPEGCDFCNQEINQDKIEVKPVPPDPYIEPSDDGTETYEEFMAKLKAKADAAKADIKAGRYRNGEVHENISQTNPIMPATAEERGIPDTGMSDLYSRILKMIDEMPESIQVRRDRPLFHDMYMGRFETTYEGDTVTGRFSSRYPHFENIMPRKIPSLEKSFDYIIMDELTPSTEAQKVSYNKLLKRRFFHDSYGPTPVGETGPEKPEPDWKRKTFVSGPETKPDAVKRAKLRAKRKKK